MKYLIVFLLIAGHLSIAQEQSQPAAEGVTSDSVATYVITEEVLPTLDTALVRFRLAALQNRIPLTYNSITHQFCDFFAYRKPSFTKTMLEKMSLYFPLYEEYLKKYGLPDELKYLSMIESALNPKAISYAGAGGLWQFMPRTARLDFGLRIDEYVDERLDPVKSTEAACKYMNQLYRIFGDWELVLAAYNTGPGNVKRAIRRSGNRQGFWEIYNHLHKQTRGYVPQYVGMVYMINHAADHGIMAENIESPMAYDTVHINTYTNLERFAEFSTVPLDVIQKLNPHVLKTELPAWTRSFPLRVPQELKGYIVDNRQMITDSANYRPNLNVPAVADSTSVQTLAENGQTVAVDDDIEDVVLRKKPRKTSYKVHRGETLSSIADKLNVDLYDLRVWNHLKKSSQIRAGQRLVVFKEQVATRTDVYAKSSRKNKDKGWKTKYYTVQHGDTLWEISQRYGGISIDKLKRMNGIRGNSVKAGQKLRVG